MRPKRFLRDLLHEVYLMEAVEDMSYLMMNPSQILALQSLLYYLIRNRKQMMVLLDDSLESKMIGRLAHKLQHKIFCQKSIM